MGKPISFLLQENSRIVLAMCIHYNHPSWTRKMSPNDANACPWPLPVLFLNPTPAVSRMKHPLKLGACKQGQHEAPETYYLSLAPYHSNSGWVDCVINTLASLHFGGRALRWSPGLSYFPKGNTEIQGPTGTDHLMTYTLYWFHSFSTRLLLFLCD